MNARGFNYSLELMRRETCHVGVEHALRPALSRPLNPWEVNQMIIASWRDFLTQMFINCACVFVLSCSIGLSSGCERLQ
jgi:hypothetical protein